MASRHLLRGNLAAVGRRQANRSDAGNDPGPGRLLYLGNPESQGDQPLFAGGRAPPGPVRQADPLELVDTTGTEARSSRTVIGASFVNASPAHVPSGPGLL